jgi:tRNA-dihydrouridine synthase C
MEGLADALLRDLLTRAGGYDGAVCQFIRVSGTALPKKTFRRVCPELDDGGRTPAGTPVAVQLLGSCPARLGETAARLAELSPCGIDLNFGCPAPTVNRHGGGAALLDDPELLRRIAESVRRAVPEAIPVTAKMRLGVRDTARTLDCAAALETGGVAALVVHPRTGIEGYRPPAHWEWIARVREAVSVPVIGNGEIWSVADYLRCREIAGCGGVMIGRGAVADPFLAQRIRQSADGREAGNIAAGSPEDWARLSALLREFWQRVQSRVTARHAPGRLKLWLNLLRRAYPQADALYRRIRACNDVGGVSAALDACAVQEAMPPETEPSAGPRYSSPQPLPGAPEEEEAERLESRLKSPLSLRERGRGKGEQPKKPLQSSVSRAPTSNQNEIHRNLAALLERRWQTPFRKPYAVYNRAAFAASVERWQRTAPGAPLILDTGCGTGESSLVLASRFPDHYVIGVDQSWTRLRRRLAAQEAKAAPPDWPPNVGFARADGVDYVRLLCDAGIRLTRHYLLYPNPWPKLGQLARRWHAHPVFPTLLELGGVLECRSNWRIYVEEFCFAVGALSKYETRCEPFVPVSPLTPFERKYHASGHDLYRAVVDLRDLSPFRLAEAEPA